MRDIHEFENAMPVAPLKLIALPSCTTLGNDINSYLVNCRKRTRNVHMKDPAFIGYRENNYLVDCSCPRFGTGEGKGVFNESIRGKDLYILCDVCNYSLTYTVNGHINHMSPDDHYQDLKRMIAAVNGKAHRVTVIMPFLYEGRQHRRSARESLDCALALEELYSMGVSDIVTFDAHDPRVANASPLSGFDSFSPNAQFVKALLSQMEDLIIDKEHTIVISPDEGALERAVYFANVMHINTGMFYKRRDYTTIVNGKNPIVAHEFLGEDIDGKDVIIVDDMISSGESMLDTAKQLKSMNAKRVFICATFGLFTNGLAAFDKAYEHCYFDRLITTNLNYRNPELLKRPYYIEADMSTFLASVIDYMNHDISLANALTPADRIEDILKLYNARENMPV